MAALEENNDQPLILRTQQGDPAAFDDLIRKYYSPLYGLVYHMTSNHEDTNDLLQDIFSKAYRSIHSFRSQSSFYTWIYRIAINMSINFIKKRGRHQHISLQEIEAKDQESNTDPHLIAPQQGGDPHYLMNSQELKKKLNQALLKLSHQHRIVVTLFDIQGLPQAEIAKILNTSQGTVRSRLFYAHRQLKNYLQ